MYQGHKCECKKCILYPSQVLTAILSRKKCGLAVYFRHSLQSTDLCYSDGRQVSLQVKGALYYMMQNCVHSVLATFQIYELVHV